jgi:hypothetical protein
MDKLIELNAYYNPNITNVNHMDNLTDLNAIRCWWYK